MKLKDKIQQVLVTKLLENGHDSETSTKRESSADVDVGDAVLEISSFWLNQEVRFQKLSGERRSLNSSNIRPTPPIKIIMKKRKLKHIL